MALNMTSAIQVSPPGTSCDVALAGLTDPHILMRTPGVDDVDEGTDADGIFRDNNAHDAAFDFVPTADPIPAGFAIVTNVGDHARITRDPPTSDGFVIVQEIPQDPTNVLLWFRDGLGTNQRIHIEPQ